jgi:hypothetical protein
VSSEELMRRRERAYLSMNNLDAIADMLAHVEQNGSANRKVASRVERAEKLVREAVTAAYYEIETITEGMRP